MRYKKDLKSDGVRAGLVLKAVELEFSVTPIDPNSPESRGGPTVVLARQIAIYLFRTVYNMNMARAARAFRRDPATAKHACDVIEASREDPVLDRRLRKLEAFLRLAPIPADCR
jgi:chromosomal replication initiation ATPase DnaA